MCDVLYEYKRIYETILINQSNSDKDANLYHTPPKLKWGWTVSTLPSTYNRSPNFPYSCICGMRFQKVWRWLHNPHILSTDHAYAAEPVFAMLRVYRDCAPFSFWKESMHGQGRMLLTLRWCRAIGSSCEVMIVVVVFLVWMHHYSCCCCCCCYCHLKEPK